MFLAKIGCGQDSVAAVYINEIIQKIEARTFTEIVERKDTILYDDNDTSRKGPALTVRTQFYTNPETMLLDKIVEKTVYKKISTELVVYFFNNQPVRFTNKQWEGTTVRFDFDIYYMNGNPVHLIKRNPVKGTPDEDMCLQWCYQLQKEYGGVVQEYNQLFARRN